MSVVHSQQTSSPLRSVKASYQCLFFGTALEMWLEKRQRNSSSLPGVIFLLSRNFPVKSFPFLSASHSFSLAQNWHLSPGPLPFTGVLVQTCLQDCIHRKQPLLLSEKKGIILPLYPTTASLLTRDPSKTGSQTKSK